MYKSAHDTYTSLGVADLSAVEAIGADLIGRVLGSDLLVERRGVEGGGGGGSVGLEEGARGCNEEGQAHGAGNGSLLRGVVVIGGGNLRTGAIRLGS